MAASKSTSGVKTAFGSMSDALAAITKKSDKNINELDQISKKAQQEFENAKKVQLDAENAHNKAMAAVRKEKIAVIQETINKVTNADFGVTKFDADEIERLMKKVRNGKYDTAEHVLESYETIAHLREYFVKFPIMDRIYAVAEKLGFPELKLTRNTGAEINFVRGYARNPVEGEVDIIRWDYPDSSMGWNRGEVNTPCFTAYYNSMDKSRNAELTFKIGGKVKPLAMLNTDVLDVWPQNIRTEKEDIDYKNERVKFPSWTSSEPSHLDYVPSTKYGIRPPEIWIYMHGRHLSSMFNLQIGDDSRDTIGMINEYRIQSIKLLPEFVLEPGECDGLRNYRSLGETAMVKKHRDKVITDAVIARALINAYPEHVAIKNLLSVEDVIEDTPERHKIAQEMFPIYDPPISDIDRVIKKVIRDTLKPEFNAATYSIEYKGCSNPIYIGDQTLATLKEYIESKINITERIGKPTLYTVNIYPLSQRDITPKVRKSLVGKNVGDIFNITRIGSVSEDLCRRTMVYLTVEGELIHEAEQSDRSTKDLFATIIDGELTGFYFKKAR